MGRGWAKRIIQNPLRGDDFWKKIVVDDKIFQNFLENQFFNTNFWTILYSPLSPEQELLKTNFQFWGWYPKYFRDFKFIIKFRNAQIAWNARIRCGKSRNLFKIWAVIVKFRWNLPRNYDFFGIILLTLRRNWYSSISKQRVCIKNLFD